MTESKMDCPCKCSLPKKSLKDDDRFSYDDNGTINGVIIYLAQSHLELAYGNFALFDALRETLADAADDFFAELDTETEGKKENV